MEYSYKHYLSNSPTDLKVDEQIYSICIESRLANFLGNDVQQSEYVEICSKNLQIEIFNLFLLFVSVYICLSCVYDVFYWIKLYCVRHMNDVFWWIKLDCACNVFYYLKDMDFYWIKRYSVCYLNYALLGPIVSRFFLEACT